MSYDAGGHSERDVGPSATISGLAHLKDFGTFGTPGALFMFDILDEPKQ